MRPAHWLLFLALFTAAPAWAGWVFLIASIVALYYDDPSELPKLPVPKLVSKGRYDTMTTTIVSKIARPVDLIAMEQIFEFYSTLITSCLENAEPQIYDPRIQNLAVRNEISFSCKPVLEPIK